MINNFSTAYMES